MPDTELRPMTEAELKDFIQNERDNPTPDVPGTRIVYVASHTPADPSKLPDDALIDYSPTEHGKFGVRIYGKQLDSAKDEWVAKLKFEGDWDPTLVPTLEAMELSYEEATHSLVAHDIIVIENKLKLDTYKVHLVRGKETDSQKKWGFRDMLTWEFIEPLHPLNGFHIVTAYVWCVH